MAPDIAIKAAMIELDSVSFKNKNRNMNLEEVSIGGDPGGVEQKERYDQTISIYVHEILKQKHFVICIIYVGKL